jgi:hypothetical protein
MCLLKLIYRLIKFKLLLLLIEIFKGHLQICAILLAFETQQVSAAIISGIIGF